jgi:regulator of sigma E protease
LTTVLAFFLVLGPLVFFHELGHFILAKRAGIRVIEFGFGYPPRLWKFWQSAGSISIAGMRIAIPKNFRAPLPREEAERLFKKPASKDTSAGFGRLDEWTPLPGDVMDVMENGRYVQALVTHHPDGSRVLSGIKLLDPSTRDAPAQDAPGVRPDANTRVVGDVTDYAPGTIYSLNWLPLGGFTRMLGEEDPTAPDSFAAAPKRWRTAVLVAGPSFNLILAFVLFVLMFMAGTPEPKGLRVFVASVTPGSPADVAGLLPNDVVLAVNGQDTETTTEVSQVTRAHLGQEITLSIQRDQAKLDLRATPRRADQFDPTKEGPLGITIGMTATLGWSLRYYSLFEAVPMGFSATALGLGEVVVAPVAIIRGLIPLSMARPIGPVGIAQIAGAEAEASLRLGGLFPILNLAGLLSVAIGLTNLLPLPALDGGRLMFILIEAIRRRRVDPKKETIVHLIGLAFLLMLMVIITLQDILNPIAIPRSF